MAAVLRAKVVESRLHMDAPDEIDPENWPVQRRLQQELIGHAGVPYYAVLDPDDGEFLYRLYLKGGDFDLFRQNLLKIFERLPPKKA